LGNAAVPTLQQTGILCPSRLDEIAEVGTSPGPGVVRDHVG